MNSNQTWQVHIAITPISAHYVSTTLMQKVKVARFGPGGGIIVYLLGETVWMELLTISVSFCCSW